MNPSGKYASKATNVHAKVFDLLRKGAIKPLSPVTIFPFSQFEQGFRALQSGYVRGKVVFVAEPDEMVPVMPQEIVSQPLDANSMYLLVGGLGGIGRALAVWMVSKGARNLAFVSRSGASTDDAKEFLATLNRDGTTAVAFACDVSNTEQLKGTLQTLSETMPKIKGVLQCAMVLRVSYLTDLWLLNSLKLMMK
jgi:hypothetical protein